MNGTFLVTYYDGNTYAAEEPVYTKQQAVQVAENAFIRGNRNIRIWECVANTVATCKVEFK